MTGRSLAELSVAVDLRGSNGRRHFAKRLLVAVGAILALLTGAALLAGPLLLRPVAERRLALWLGREVTIERVQIDPFRLSVTADHLQVREADGATPFLTIRRLYVNLEMASIVRRALIVREIRIESPRARLQRRAAGGASGGTADYNISDVVARVATARNATAAVRGPLPRFSLNNIRVLDGELVFDDEPLRCRHIVTEVAVGIPFVSTLPTDIDTFVEPGASGRIDGAPWVIKGQTKPFKDTRQSVVELRLSAVDLVPYLPYVPALRLPPGARVASAELTVALELAFARPRDEAPLLSLRGTAALGNVALRERGPAARKLLDLQHIGVTVSDIDLLARRYFIDDVVVSGLDASLRRSANHALSLPGLWSGKGPADAATGARAPHASSDEGVRFSVRHLRLVNSIVHFNDEAADPAFAATADDIALSVDHLSNAPGNQATVTATLQASPGGAVSLDGRFSLDPLTSSGTISVDGIEPRRLAPYWRDAVTFEIVRGRLRLSARYELADRGDHVTLHLREGSGDGHDLTLRRPPARTDFLTVPELTVRGGDIDFDRHTIFVAEVSTRDGRLGIIRDGQGAVDLATLNRPTTAPAAPSAPWKVTVARLDARAWGIRFEDRAVAPPAVVSLRSLSLQATSLSTMRGSTGEVDLRTALARSGRLTLGGTLSFDPPAVDWRADLRAADLVPLRGYIREKLNLLLTSGLVSFKGEVRAELSPDGANAGSGPSEARVRLAGDADVTDVRLVAASGPAGGAGRGQSDDEAGRDHELLRWRSLHADGLQIATSPVSFAAAGARLTDFSARAGISPQRRFNWSEVFVRSSPVARAIAGGAPAPRSADVSLGRVVLTGGEVSFLDRSIRPSCAVQLTGLAARVTGLSTSPGARAEVELHGRLGAAGLIAVAGTASPLQRVLSLDLKGEAKGVDLRPASPYAARYLGYPLESGTLSLAVRFHIADRKLDAQNRLLLDQLSLGEKVESPEAVKLPVKLAIALLKDRRGVIDVDLPLSGALAAPHFKLPDLVWKALRGKMIAATEAPFPLIARAFGGGQASGDLSSLAFQAGLASLDGEARTKLQHLADALRDRPELAFELRGEAEPGQDREGLRRERREHGLDAPIGEEDLRDLARRRAEAVRTALVRLVPVATGRLFLVEPRVEGRAPRVELKVKEAD